MQVGSLIVSYVVMCAADAQEVHVRGAARPVLRAGGRKAHNGLARRHEVSKNRKHNGCR